MALFLLGRKLMQVAESALPQGKAATSVRLVLVDVAYHPNSSISEITERTGFPQSLVSAAVARLREARVLESEPDPSDRRRTLVRTTPALREIGQSAGQVPIDAVLAKGLTAEQQGQVPEAVAALDVLARLLTPEVFADDDADKSRPAADMTGPSSQPDSSSSNGKHRRTKGPACSFSSSSAAATGRSSGHSSA
jgi:DNA-binding MarR family transcriptional regulator